MRFLFSDLLQEFRYYFIGAALVVLILSAGCTQTPAGTTNTTNGILVTHPDDSHISVAFVGATGMDSLIEMEMTITDSNGKSITKSKGSRLGTTPIQIHATDSFTGSYSGKNHVLVTGYFSDGSQRVLVDRDI